MVDFYLFVSLYLLLQVAKVCLYVTILRLRNSSEQLFCSSVFMHVRLQRYNNQASFRYEGKYFFSILP